MGSSEQLSRFLLVKNLHVLSELSAEPPSTRSWSSAFDSPPRSSWTSSTNSWNCREVPALSQCAPHSRVNRTLTSHSKSTIVSLTTLSQPCCQASRELRGSPVSANRLRCHVGIRRTGSAKALVTFGRVVVVS